MKPGVIFLNFGGPTNVEELEPFLRNLLSDVLPGPEALARFAAGRIAPRRAKKVQEAYEAIGWSPLVPDTLNQADATMELVGDDDLPYTMGMMFSEPSIPAAVDELLGQGCDALIAIGLFPHYSFATSASAFDMLHKALVAAGRPHLPVHHAPAFFEHPSYVEAVAQTVRHALGRLQGEGPIHLLFSAHGIPTSFVRRGDPYPEQVKSSVRHVVRQLSWPDPWHLSWQSRLGPVRWLEPNTEVKLEELAHDGVKRLVLVPVSFVGEHIETLDELDREYVPMAREAGITHIERAPALGLEPSFLRCLADQVRDALHRFGRYRCARCLVPQPDAHRRRGSCPDCNFVQPVYLRDGNSQPA